MFMGDVNAANPLWGSNIIKPRGRLLENFIQDYNLSIPNDESPTYISSTYGSFSVLDPFVT